MVKSYSRFEYGRTLGQVSANSAVVALPGGSAGWVAVGACEAILIWDLKTGDLKARLYDPGQSAAAQTLQLVYEARSSLLAAGYSDGSVRVWDLATRSVLVTLQGHKSGVTSLAFDFAGTKLISGSFDTSIIVWDLIEETGICRLKGHKAQITALVLLPGDQWLISVSKDGIIKLWDIVTQFSVETHVAHKAECWALAASPLGDRLVSFANTTEVKFWTVDLEQPEGQRIRAAGVLDKQSRHRPVAVLWRDSYIYAASPDAAQVWRERSEDEKKKALRRKEKRAQKGKSGNKKGGEDHVEAPVIELTASDIYLSQAVIRGRAKIHGLTVSDETNRVILNLGNNALESWTFLDAQNELLSEPEVAATIELPGHRTDVRDVAISPDNKLIASGSNGLLKVHNSRSGAVLRTIADTGFILCTRFLPGGSLLVTGTKEGTIDIYDLPSASRIESIDAHKGAVWSLDVAADGKSIVSASADKSVKFWDLKVVKKEVVGQPDVTVNTMTLKNTHKLEFADEVLAVKLSPDSRYVAASLLDNTIKVYYRDTLKFFLNLYGHHLPVLSIDISYDSKLLISSSADKNIKIWGLDFGDVHKSIFGHDDSIIRVVFEPQTHNFFSCSKDGLVKYWDGDKFQQIQKLQGHHGEVWALACSNDGMFVVSAAHDKTIRIWELTDEPLFLEEERENELEQTHEEQLIESLDRDENMADDAQAEADIAEAVTKNTIDSLKAGERLYEALQICVEDVTNRPNPRNNILTALDVSADKYLMDTLCRIKPNLVEDALLTFPLESVTGLFKFFKIWLEQQLNLPIVCRVLFFCLRTFHRQLISNRMLKPEIDDIRRLLREQISSTSSKIGFNIAYLNYVKEQWALEHVHSLETAGETGPTRKRELPTTAV